MKISFKLVFILFTIAAVFFSCSYLSDEELEYPDDSELSSQLRNLNKLIQPEETGIVDLGVVGLEDPNRPGDLLGYTSTVRKYKAALGFDELFCMDPTTDVIYPGAIIDGETVLTGAYMPVTAKRAPLTFSISLPFTTGSVARTVENPTLSNIRQAMAEIHSEIFNGSSPARVIFDIEEVYSEEQLKIGIGANLSVGSSSLSASFDFNKSEIQSRILVKFMQVYYSYDIDIPENPDDFFDGSVSWEELNQQLSGSTSPTYVSSIQYGRIGFFSFESSASMEEIKIAVNASYNGIITNASASVDVEHINILNESTMKVMIIGGNGQSAVQSINGFEGFKWWITDSGSFSSESTAAPLSYKLRFLSDNSVARIVLSSEYYIRTSTLIPENPATRYRVRVEYIKPTDLVMSMTMFKENIYLYTGYDSEGNIYDDVISLDTGALREGDKYQINSEISYIFNKDKLYEAYITLYADLNWFHPMHSASTDPIRLDRKIYLSDLTPGGDDGAGKYYLNFDMTSRIGYGGSGRIC